jgi:hypothetical protein
VRASEIFFTSLIQGRQSVLRIYCMKFWYGSADPYL